MTEVMGRPAARPVIGDLEAKSEAPSASTAKPAEQ